MESKIMKRSNAFGTTKTNWKITVAITAVVSMLALSSAVAADDLARRAQEEAARQQRARDDASCAQS